MTRSPVSMRLRESSASLLERNSDRNRVQERRVTFEALRDHRPGRGTLEGAASGSTFGLGFWLETTADSMASSKIDAASL